MSSAISNKEKKFVKVSLHYEVLTENFKILSDAFKTCWDTPRYC